MEQEGQTPAPTDFAAVFDRLCALQEEGKPVSLGVLMASLHDHLADVPEDRAATAILGALGFIQFGGFSSQVVPAELQARRQELISIITRERAAAAGRTRTIRVRLDPDGDYVEREIQQAPSAQLMAAVAELEEIDATLPIRPV